MGVDQAARPAADELRDFLAAALPEFRRTWGAAKDFAARVAWQRLLSGAGWAAPAWPAEYGGRGLGIVDAVRCDDELAGADAPVMAGVLGISNVGPTIMAWGTPEQKDLLPLMLSGEHIWCQGFSEPEAGSDLASLRMRADSCDDGFTLNGQKVWTSDGMDSTHCMLLARTNGGAAKHDGLSILLVSLDRPGIDRRPLRQMTGREGFAEVFFTDVRVPRGALLGPVNEGWRVARTTLGYERAGVITQAARLERDVLRTIGELPGGVADPMSADALTDVFVQARVLSWLGQRVLADVADGTEPGPAQSVIKLAWSQVMQQLGEAHFGTLGAAGLTAPATSDAVERFLRTRSATIAAGTTEILRDVLAERVLGLPRRLGGRPVTGGATGRPGRRRACPRHPPGSGPARGRA